MNIVNNVLYALQIKEAEVNLIEAVRLKRNADPNVPHTKPPMILVKLASPTQKAPIFRNIRHLKESGFPNISITNEYPPSIRSAVAAKEKMSYEIRQSRPGTKTKIKISQLGEPEIWIKNPGQMDFKKLEPNHQADPKSKSSRKHARQSYADAASAAQAKAAATDVAAAHPATQ